MENITWNYLIDTAPDIIKFILDGLKQHKENPLYHPEGNAYDHIRIVTERLIPTGDMDLIMAGFFHDLGKLSTAAQSDEGDWNSSHGHENISSKLVLRYKDWVQEMGANPYVVNEIVKNHMRIKFNAISKKDKDRLERYTIFQKLTQFTDADNMKKPWNLNEGLNLPKKTWDIEIVRGHYVEDNWGRIKRMSREILINQLTNPEEYSDDDTFVGVDGTEYTIDDLMGKNVKYGRNIYYVESDRLEEGLNLPKKTLYDIKNIRELQAGDTIVCVNIDCFACDQYFTVGKTYSVLWVSDRMVGVEGDKNYMYNANEYDLRDSFKKIQTINEGLNLPKKPTSNRWVPTSKQGEMVVNFLNDNYDVDISTLSGEERPVSVNIGTSQIIPKSIIVRRMVTELGLDQTMVSMYYDNWLMSTYMYGKPLNEGLNLRKSKGSKQFDNITVFYEILPHDETTRKHNIQNPVRLTYLIDGEAIPDNTADPKFSEMVNKLEPTFSEKIRPYFESLGYTLWSY